MALYCIVDWLNPYVCTDMHKVNDLLAISENGETKKEVEVQDNVYLVVKKEKWSGKILSLWGRLNFIIVYIN